MAIFKDLFSSSRGQQDASSPLERDAARSNGPETMPVKMNLEERMAFRRELLYESLRSSLGARAIAAHTYRFKAMRTDKRGHCFVIMLDMSPTFMASESGQHTQLDELAALVIDNAKKKYGLHVGGLYWRSDGTLDTVVARWATRRSPVGLDTSPEDTPPLSSVETYEQATAQELADFEAAWHSDNAVQIGNRTYSTDLASLDSGPVIK